MRIHLGQGRGGLGDDRGVIALSWGVHGSEAELRRLQRGSEPAPREAAVTLAQAPGREVIGAHRGLETRSFGGEHVAQQATRGMLFVRAVISDEHEATFFGECELARAAISVPMITLKLLHRQG